MMEVKYPLADKVARHFFVSELKPEDVGYLGRENGYGDTARSAIWVVKMVTAIPLVKPTTIG